MKHGEESGRAESGGWSCTDFKAGRKREIQIIVEEGQ